MIRICPDIALQESELRWEFVRSPGPGGQHVNKAATAAQLRFDAAASPHIPRDVRERLLGLPDRRITADGVILITARRFRSREQNRQDALQRLAALIHKAARAPARRIASQPTQTSRQRRLAVKKLLGRTKRLRRQVAAGDD